MLLTGVSGFLGSHALRHILTNTDWSVVGIASFKHTGRLDRINIQLNGLDRSRFRLVAHDLVNPITPEIAREIGSIDYVLNYASESHVDRSIATPRPFIHNNIELMLTMLEYVRQYPVKKFIHVNTDEQYGPIQAQDGGWKEGSPHRPSNAYSASKAAQDDLLHAYWRTYRIPAITTACLNLIGELQDPEKFVPKIIGKVLRGETVHIHAAKDGTPGSRFYLHARNHADALLFIANKVDPILYDEGVLDMERFNITTLDELDNLSLAQIVASKVGKPLIHELADVHSSRPGHDRRYGLDGSKLAALGWKAPVGFDEGMNKTIQWYLDHQEWL